MGGPHRLGKRRHRLREQKSGMLPDSPKRVGIGETMGLALISLVFVGVFGWALLRSPAPSDERTAEPTTPAHSVSPADASPARPTEALRELSPPPGRPLPCESPRVVDGDTVRCGETLVRLSSIDAPELPGHCRRNRACTPGDPYASTENLRRLVGSNPLVCNQVDQDHYGRAVAFCTAAGVDLSCAQVGGGFAVQRYRELHC